MFQDNRNSAEGTYSLLIFFYFLIRTYWTHSHGHEVRQSSPPWNLANFFSGEVHGGDALIPINFWICRLIPPYFRFNLALVASEAASEFRNPFTVSAASPSTQLSSRSILKYGDKEVSSTQLKNAAHHVRFFILSPENLGIGIRRFLYTSFRDALVIPTIHPVAFRCLSILPQLFISSTLPGTIRRLSRSNISRSII